MGSWGGGGTAEGALLKEVVQGGFAVLNMENSVGYSVFFKTPYDQLPRDRGYLPPAI